MVNIRFLEPGAKVKLFSGATAEVVDNPQDGMWVMVRYLTSPEDSSKIGTEESILAPDVVEVLEAS